MPRFLISTVRRRCQANEPSGYLYVVDPLQSRVLQRCDIVEPRHRELDLNPRGGMRGAKGISIRPEQIALANFSLIQCYDPQWNLLRAFSHPSCAGIHDILFDGEYLWAAAARADLLVRFNLDGTLDRHYDLRQPSPAIQALGWNPPVLHSPQDIRCGVTDFRHPLSVEKETYDRAHVNSVCRLPDGDLLVSLGFVFNDRYASLLRMKILLIRRGIWPVLKKSNQAIRRMLGANPKNMDANLVVKPAKAQSAIIRISEDGQHSLVLKLGGITAPSHSLLALPDGSLIYLNTSDGDLLHIDPQNGRVRCTVSLSQEGFLRGVTCLDSNRLLVGSRGDLIVFHLPSGQAQSILRITDDPIEAIYDIKELPDHYDPPPASFAEHFSVQMDQQISGFVR